MAWSADDASERGRIWRRAWWLYATAAAWWSSSAGAIWERLLGILEEQKNALIGMFNRPLAYDISRSITGYQSSITN